jgi:hypothetical protein
MATNLDVLAAALGHLNVISEIETPSAEQGAHALARLNDMLQLWSEDGCDLQWFAQSSTADTYPLPDWTRQAVESNLAIAIAPRYGASASPELIALASSSYAAVLRKCIVENLRGANMDHMPMGERGRGWIYNIQTDR